MSADTLLAPRFGRRALRVVPDRERRLYTYAALAILLAFVLTTWATGFNPVEALVGSGPLFQFLYEDFLPPVFHNPPLLWQAVLDTIWLAVTSTFVASILAFVAALFGSKAITPVKWLSPVIRGFATFVRNIPDLVWAFILFSALGIGTGVGFAALTVTTFAFLTRAFIESLDEVSADATEGLAAAGANFPQRVAQSVAPSFVKDFIAWFLYSIEVNIRGATIVGMVGGGGIGFMLFAQLRNWRHYPRATGTILVLAALVIVVDLLTSYLRNKLLQPEATTSAVGMKRQTVAIERRGRIALRKRGQDRPVRLFLLGALALSVLAFALLDVDWARLISRVPNLGTTFLELGQLDFSAMDRTLDAFVETIGIAVLSTLYSVVAALIIAPFATRNLVRGRIAPLVITSVATFIRTVPNPVLVLIAMASFGLGPVPGIVGLTLSSTAFFIRVFVQGFEDVPAETIEALQATGANRIQVFGAAMVPAAMSHMVAWAGLRFEMNFMGSAILGMVGAGGIGALITNAIRGHAFGVAGVAILLVFAFAYAMEMLLTKVKRDFVR